MDEVLFLKTTSLSEKEREIIRLIAREYSDSVIAQSLHMNEEALKRIIQSNGSKLSAQTREEIVFNAYRQRLLP